MAQAAPPEPKPVMRALRFATSPPLVALILTVVLAAAGAIVLYTYGPPGAVAPEVAAAAPDGDVHTAGRIVAQWVDGNPSVTHWRLAGAPDLDIVVDGDVLGLYPDGSTVEVRGTKLSGTLRPNTMHAARDPVASAVPYLVGASAAGAALVAHLLFGAPGERLAASLRRRNDKPPSPEIAVGQREPDNHSGAPAPKS